MNEKIDIDCRYNKEKDSLLMRYRKALEEVHALMCGSIASDRWCAIMVSDYELLEKTYNDFIIEEIDLPLFAHKVVGCLNCECCGKAVAHKLVEEGEEDKMICFECRDNRKEKDE